MRKTEKTYAASFFYPLMLFLAVIMIALDQWTKILAVDHLKGQDPIVLIKNVLEIYYLENHGAAFGMLQNKQYFFWIITVVFLVIALCFFRKVPKTGRFMPLSLSVVMLVAGAIGNFIDRITLQYVRDFIYFKLINFPVFNVADIYVTVGVILLVVLLLFVYKEEELNIFSIRK